MRLTILLLPLFVLPATVAGSTMPPAFTASGHFVTGDPFRLNNEQDACAMPAWDGTFGSCLTLPDGLAGHDWTLSVDRAMQINGLMLCFVAPDRSLCVLGGGGQTLSNNAPESAIPSWTRQVVITSDHAALQIDWTLRVA